VSEERVAVVEWQPEILAPPPSGLEPATGQCGREPSRPTQVSSDRTRMEYVDARDRGADDMALEAGADDLDLR
jgi:hypothetical protein